LKNHPKKLFKSLDIVLPVMLDYYFDTNI